MSDRIGEGARLEVYSCLNRFEVDPIQCVSWESHIFLANRTQFLPVRLLDEAEIGGGRMSVSARDGTHGSISFDGTHQDAFQLGLAAIENSDLKRLTLRDPAGEPISDDELENIDAVAASVKVVDLRLQCDLRHLSADSLRGLMFDFPGVKQLRLHHINGSQLTDEHLQECGRRQIWEFLVDCKDAGPLAVSDEAVLNFLYAPEYGMPKRWLNLPSFNATPQFVQKLVERAHEATNIHHADLDVEHLPLGSQQLGGLHVTEREGTSEYNERDENGILSFSFDTIDLFRFIDVKFR